MLTTLQVDQIIAQHRAGRGRKAIAAEFGISPQHVSKLLAARGVRSEHAPNFWTPEEDARLLDGLRKGLTQAEIAATMPGRTLHGVSGRLKHVRHMLEKPAPKQDEKPATAHDLPPGVYRDRRGCSLPRLSFMDRAAELLGRGA